MSRIDDLINDLCPNGVRFRKLADVGQIVTGLSGKSKEDFSDGNLPFLSYKTVFNNICLPTEIYDKVKIGPDERQNTLHLGDVVITGSSETPRELGMSCVVTHEPESPVYLNSFCFIWRPNGKELEPDFSKFVFRSNSIREQIIRAGNGVTRINISKNLFLKIEIPIPPIEIQREIVSILDKFTELEAEIEAELEARRKQYEHYRNQLLTFSTLEEGGGPVGTDV